MKVLMQNRADAFTNSGGDTVQMLKTKEELEKLGAEVDISLELEPNLEGYDIVHLFNISRINETWMQCVNAKKQGKKIVVSTIYHCKKEIREYEEKAFIGLNKIIKKVFNNDDKLELIKTTARVLSGKKGLKSLYKQFFIGYSNQQKDVIEMADILLPNSEKEMNVLCEELKVDKSRKKYRVIPNGVDIDSKSKVISNDLFIEKYGYKDFIFCVGRIEPLKNQIKLIEALKDTNNVIVFAGAINKKHKKYYKKFINEVNLNENIHYIGLLDRKMLFSGYKSAKVTILPSWFETTGLVGLESLYMGTNVIITERGYTKEYYNTYVEYCNPNELSNLKEIIPKQKKWNMKVSTLLNQYTWSSAASTTLKVYKTLLNIS